MGKLPIGVQSFEKIINDGFVYADKTEYIQKLLNGGKVYYLSRPRRFGKSLFLSTLKAYFEGRKELFSGLKIYDFEEKSPLSWEKYPIIYISFAKGDFKKETGLSDAISYSLEEKKFVFITGVTKFSKVSLFSDLNQLEDISLSEEYAGICGITEEELENTFASEIEALAKKNDISVEECIEELKKNYDGYHFSAGGIGVYNPFSLLNCFSNKDFERYLFATGTPTFLINAIMKSGRPIEDMSEGISATKDRMENFRADQSDFVPLFYQSGYISIVGYDKKFRTYKLAFPNNEVEYGFLEVIIPLASPKYEAPDDAFSSEKMTGYLENCDVDSFMTMIKALLASLPYYEGEAPSNEQQWRNVVYAIFKILGQYMHAEVHSARGRSDCIVETGSFVYIFEFKQDKTSGEALSQIDEKGYGIPFISSGKKIVKIGANFSTELRTLDDWKVEKSC